MKRPENRDKYFYLLRLLFILALLSLIVGVIRGAGALTQGEPYYVGVNSMNFRKEPSTDADKVSSLLINEELLFIEEVPGTWWVKVQHSNSGSEGYVLSYFLSLEKDYPIWTGEIVTDDYVNIREKPSKESKRVAKLKYGTTVKVLYLTTDGLWYRIQYGEGAKAFVMKEYVL